VSLVFVFAGCLFAGQEASAPDSNQVVSSAPEANQVVTSAPDPDQPSTKISGYTAIEAGQVVAGRYFKMSDGVYHDWMGSGYLNISVRSHINKYVSVLGTMETRLGYNTSPVDQVFDPTDAPQQQQLFIYFPNAEGLLTFGNNEHVGLTIGIGRFEYKYNSQSQNLGEYLFRTGTYPAYVQTSFDLSLARLNGLIASLNIGNFLRQDLLVTTFRDIKPFYNFSFTYLADWKIIPALDMGIAISGANLISVADDQTSLHNNANSYIKAPGDTEYYTYRGTKAMARFTFDPKRFASDQSILQYIFGEEGGKIYGEAAILGAKDYPASNNNPIGYNRTKDKIPIMLGVNIPTSKWGLDVLAWEVEWYGCKYPDGYNLVVRYGYAVPDNPQQLYGTSDDYLYDDWKWSIYAKKTLFNNFCLIFQAARDHLRFNTQIKRDEDYSEVLSKWGHWYWMAKVKFYY
jgi:hypothetical protein